MQFSEFVLPLTISLILLSGFIKKVPLFDTFLKGARGGLETSVSVLPSIIGLVTAISMLRASGFIDFVVASLSPVISRIGFPTEVLPLALLKPVSGGASLVVLQDIFNTYGPDSVAGRVASVISGSTETTFYTLAVYFAATNARNTRHTLKSALLADLTGILLGAWFVYILLC